MQTNALRSISTVLSLAFIVAVVAGGYFYPLIGLIPAFMILLALGLAVFGKSSRSFCSGLCPRGRALSPLLGSFSRMRPLPPSLRKISFRRMLCGIMMFCMIGNLARASFDLERAGRMFWLLCVASLGGGLVVGLLYKPKAWCVICPLGAMQETAGGFMKKGRFKPIDASGETRL